AQTLDRAGRIEVGALLDGPVAGGFPGNDRAAVATPDDHRDDQAECTDGHQDPADHVHADTADVVQVQGEGEDRAHGDQEQAHADTHNCLHSWETSPHPPCRYPAVPA